MCGRGWLDERLEILRELTDPFAFDFQKCFLRAVCCVTNDIGFGRVFFAGDRELMKFADATDVCAVVCTHYQLASSARPTSPCHLLAHYVGHRDLHRPQGERLNSFG